MLREASIRKKKKPLILSVNLQNETSTCQQIRYERGADGSLREVEKTRTEASEEKHVGYMNDGKGLHAIINPSATEARETPTHIESRIEKRGHTNSAIHPHR